MACSLPALHFAANCLRCDRLDSSGSRLASARPERSIQIFDAHHCLLCHRCVASRAPYLASAFATGQGSGMLSRYWHHLYEQLTDGCARNYVRRHWRMRRGCMVFPRAKHPGMDAHLVYRLRCHCNLANAPAQSSASGYLRPGLSGGIPAFDSRQVEHLPHRDAHWSDWRKHGPLHTSNLHRIFPKHPWQLQSC